MKGLTVISAAVTQILNLGRREIDRSLKIDGPSIDGGLGTEIEERRSHSWAAPANVIPFSSSRNRE